MGVALWPQNYETEPRVAGYIYLFAIIRKRCVTEANGQINDLVF